jgi:ribonuclease-3
MYREIFEIFGTSVPDVSLIETALTHPSYTELKGLPNSACYERLEFLGDSMLKLAASEILFKMFPNAREGELSKIRSFLVSDNTLAELSLELGFNKYLRLSDSEEKAGGRVRVSNNACAFEALLGAFYLNGKEYEVKLFLNRVLEPKIKNIQENFVKYNAKEILQEYTQGIDKTLPVYTVVNEIGPAHSKIFEVEVAYNGKVLASGKGKTKKAAQIDAAYNACKNLNL